MSFIHRGCVNVDEWCCEYTTSGNYKQEFMSWVYTTITSTLACHSHNVKIANSPHPYGGRTEGRISAPGRDPDDDI